MSIWIVKVNGVNDLVILDLKLNPFLSKSILCRVEIDSIHTEGKMMDRQSVR